MQIRPSLSEDDWQSVATKAGTGPWTGSATVATESLPDDKTRVTVDIAFSPGAEVYFTRFAVAVESL